MTEEKQLKRKRKFQNGSLSKRRGAHGAWWDLRYYGADGKRATRVLGSSRELPTKTDAEKRAAEFLSALNGGRAVEAGITVGKIIARFESEEMPKAKASTVCSYAANLRKWIGPRWGLVDAGDVKPLDVEAWLRSLPLQPKSRANLRGLFHVLFECARRWEWAVQNPIDLVRQSAKRTRRLARITPAQFRSLAATLIEPQRTQVMMAGLLGLRAGELFALRWADIDFENRLVAVRRAVWKGHLDTPKTEAGERSVPLPPLLWKELLGWRSVAPFQGDGDYIFGCRPNLPPWPSAAMKQIRPVAQSVGIVGVGWHGFRHLFRAALDVVGAPDKAQQELMGHSDPATTRSYGHGLEDAKRRAMDGVAGLLLT